MKKEIKCPICGKVLEYDARAGYVCPDDGFNHTGNDVELEPKAGGKDTI